MPRKPATINDSSTAAGAARAAAPKTPRVKSSRHASKPASETSVPDLDPDAPATNGDAREEIAKIAYGYWEARGFCGGDPVEDWVRAENEYRQREAD